MRRTQQDRLATQGWGLLCRGRTEILSARGLLRFDNTVVAIRRSHAREIPAAGLATAALPTDATEVQIHDDYEHHCYRFRAILRELRCDRDALPPWLPIGPGEGCPAEMPAR